MKASSRICLLQLLRIGVSLPLFLTALIGFLMTYGETFLFLVWMAAVLFTAWLFRRHLRPLATSLMVFALSIPILWPIDAFFHYPFLRAISAVSFWGPQITAFPSPSGSCTAYVYNYSFLDSAYSVRIAHYLSFPGRPYFVPLGKLDDAGIKPSWEDGKFTVAVPSLGTSTLSYDEKTRQVTLKKKYLDYVPTQPETIIK
jgi:hypothetical protein